MITILRLQFMIFLPLKVSLVLLIWWFSTCLVASIIVVGFAKAIGDMENFKNKLERCTVHGNCQLGDSSFHRWHEKKEWELILKYQHTGLYLAMFINCFLESLIWPISGTLKFVTGKELV